jgi:hypothetical protein
MRSGSIVRRFATFLLKRAISFAPADTIEWGNAVLGELYQVERDWSALLWAIGGASMLLKHAFVAIVFPGRNHSLSSNNNLFRKGGTVRKTVTYATTACIVASLLFLLAPVFRVAVHVSLAQWYPLLHVNPFDRLEPAPQLEALKLKAIQQRDGEALAFDAVHTPDQSESVQLAEDAVRLNPGLTWVYGVVAVKWSFFPQVERWTSALQTFDPENALPHLIAAERIDIEQIEKRNNPRNARDESAEWKNAMAAAFQSPKLETYSKRLEDLNRAVILRYQINDPFLISTDHLYWRVPSYTASDSSRYSELLLEDGKSRQDRGDLSSAFEQYSTVVRFAQTLGENGGFPMAKCLRDAFQRLGSLSEKEGNSQQAELYSILAKTADGAWKEQTLALQAGLHSDVSRWNALLARASGIALVLSATVLLLSVVSLIVRHRSLRIAELQPSGMTLAFSFAGGVTALFSSILLYISYRPYAEIAQRFIHTGDNAGLADLSRFLGYTRTPLGAGWVSGKYLSVERFAFYFWCAVAGLCALVIMLSILRFLIRSDAKAANKLAG